MLSLLNTTGHRCFESLFNLSDFEFGKHSRMKCPVVNESIMKQAPLMYITLQPSTRTVQKFIYYQCYSSLFSLCFYI